MKKIYQKMIFSCIILLGFSVLSSKTLAQSIVKGKITDAQGTLLPGVSVMVTKGPGTVSNSSGEYSLTLPDGSKILTFSIVGYEKLTKTAGSVPAAIPMRVFVIHHDQNTSDVASLGYYNGRV